MDGGGGLVVETLSGLSGISRIEWDAAANPPGAAYDPFLSWDFLQALEESGCAKAETGWAPFHLLLRDGAGALLGAAPAYLKSHSYGEYVFDHNWAHAFERAGGEYYPKLLCAVPFTPVTGRRLLSAAPEAAAMLADALAEVARRSGLSSAHVNFISEENAASLQRAGFLRRTDRQFHFFNRNYRDYQDFLDALSSRHRKALRKERARAQEGLEIVTLTGSDLTEAHWDAFYAFYMDTGARKWGSPYLNRAFFALLHERMADRVVLYMARREGRWIAGALNLLGSEALYGRYWGRVEDHPFLHFELCYHRAMEETITRGLARAEAGAQGEHKLARGYEPVETQSWHWIADAGFREAVRRFLGAECAATEDEIELLSDYAPFKKT
jgi:predicted N-acyltransferase